MDRAAAERLQGEHKAASLSVQQLQKDLQQLIPAHGKAVSSINENSLVARVCKLHL